MHEIQNIVSTTKENLMVKENGDDKNNEEYGPNVLYLPSNFSCKECKTYALATHMQFELDYWISIAFNFLNSICSAVQYYKVLINLKRINTRGQKEHTAANSVI